jgi:tetratricopeptide (TPR) repeat protein
MRRKMKAVLPFEQTGAFFHKRAVMKADRHSYLDAVGFLRKALEREPDNSEYLLDLADVYARMSCYDESNRVLVSAVRTRQATPECFFGMGCNFYALRQYGHAREAFLTYQYLEPEGEYADAVEDMLDELDDMDFEHSSGGTSVLAERGARAIGDGEYRLAVRLLQRALKHEPDASFVRNNLALAYYCLGDVDKAAKETAIVLADEPNNLHANCNMAMLLNDCGRKAQANVHIGRAIDANPDNADDLEKICLTLCEMFRHADAQKHLKRLLHLRPYDKTALHQYGTACFNLGDYRAAIAAWDRVRRIDPNNPVPPYCIALSRKALAGQAVEPLSYHDQLPAEEVHRRVAEFAGNLTGSREEFARRFEQDGSFRELVRLGLGVSDPAFRRTALRLLGFIGGSIAEEMLRDFLLRPDISEEIKREAMSCLKEMGAKEPYMAVFGGTVVEVRISVFSADRALSDAQRQVVQIAVECMPFAQDAPRDERESFVSELLSLWTRYLSDQSARGHRIRRPQNWAAGLVAVYCAQKGIELDEQALCAALELSTRTLNTYVRYLQEGLSNHEHDH